MANTRETEAELEYARGYLPMWAGPPLQGGMCARLLVNKHGRLITTIDFDQRAFISLGRSTDKVTYSLDHPSISRLHALIVHHQRLQAFFLIDCGSAHGTYLAGKRIEPKVPVRIAEGTTPSAPINFGGSSRVYVLQSLALDGRTEINTQINRTPMGLHDEPDTGAVASKALVPLRAEPGMSSSNMLPSLHQVLNTGLHRSHRRPTIKERGSGGAARVEGGRVGVLRVGGGTKSPPPEILKTPLLDAMEGFHPAHQRGAADSSPKIAAAAAVPTPTDPRSPPEGSLERDTSPAAAKRRVRDLRHAVGERHGAVGERHHAVSLDPDTHETTEGGEGGGSETDVHTGPSSPASSHSTG